jgi:hypothetical protein
VILNVAAVLVSMSSILTVQHRQQQHWGKMQDILKALEVSAVKQS